MIQDIASAHPYHWLPMENEGEVKVCVIGAGKMSRAHLETLVAMPGISVTGIASNGGISGEMLAKEFGILNSYQNWKKMLDELQPDALFVAVSHTIAFELYKEVLSYGIPCMLEKPAGYNLEQTQELVDIASAHSCYNMVGVNRRFFSNIQQALIEILHQGPVRGILVETNEPISNYRSRLQYDSWVYDEWLMANSIHGIDLFRMICGDVKEVHATGKSLSELKGDHFSAVLEFENGIIGTFIAHFNSGGGFGIKIYGEGVTAEMYPLDQGLLKYATGRSIRLIADKIDTEYKAGLFAQNALFLKSVIKKSELQFPASNLKDQLKTMILIDMIRKKAMSN